MIGRYSKRSCHFVQSYWWVREPAAHPFVPNKRVSRPLIIPGWLVIHELNFTAATAFSEFYHFMFNYVPSSLRWTHLPSQQPSSSNDDTRVYRIVLNCAQLGWATAKIHPREAASERRALILISRDSSSSKQSRWRHQQWTGARLQKNIGGVERKYRDCKKILEVSKENIWCTECSTPYEYVKQSLGKTECLVARSSSNSNSPYNYTPADAWKKNFLKVIPQNTHLSQPRFTCTSTLLLLSWNVLKLYLLQLIGVFYIDLK